jgi:hypothetical protein
MPFRTLMVVASYFFALGLEPAFAPEGVVFFVEFFSAIITSLEVPKVLSA